MIAPDCLCGHREIDHDGRCQHRACGCDLYRENTPTTEETPA